MGPVRRCQTATGPRGARLAIRRPSAALSLEHTAESARLASGLDTTRFATPPPPYRAKALRRRPAGSSAIGRSSSGARHIPVRPRRSGRPHTGRGPHTRCVRANGVRAVLVPVMLGVIVTGHPDLWRTVEPRRCDRGEGSSSHGKPVDRRSRQRGRWRAGSGGVREHSLDAARRSCSPARGLVDR